MIPIAHKTALEMMETLIAYMKDDEAIRNAISAEFGWKPSVRQIKLARQMRQNRIERFKRLKWDKGGNGENDKLFWEDIRTGSDRLRDRIVAKHPKIMKALEAQGNKVVWNG